MNNNNVWYFYCESNKKKCLNKYIQSLAKLLELPKYVVINILIIDHWQIINFTILKYAYKCYTS